MADFDAVENREQRCPSPDEQARTATIRSDQPTGLPTPRPMNEDGPLINQVSNQWAYQKGPTCDEHLLDDEEREYGFCNLEDETSLPNVAYRNTLGSRRFRKRAVYVGAAFAALFWAWRTFFAPDWSYQGPMRDGSAEVKHATFEIAKGGHHGLGYDRIRDIDPMLVPGGEADPEGKRRLVFVGDIHGCRKELVALMDKIDFNPDLDHLIATGDVITKGPDSKGVIDELIRLNASSVRGNHEDQILALTGKYFETEEDVPSEEVSSYGFRKDIKLLKHLKKHHVKWLRDMPLIYRIPALPRATTSKKHHRKEQAALQEEILVVHAGLVPAIPMARQDPYYTMNMRSINHKNHAPSVERASGNGRFKPWRQIWNWYNDRLYRGRSLQDYHALSLSEGAMSVHIGPQAEDGWFAGMWDRLLGIDRLKKGPRPKPQVVIYGHDSHAGLQIHRWTKGLDSACVAGGRLTAMIVDVKGSPKLESVKCKNYK